MLHRINTCNFGPNWSKPQAGRLTPATFCHETSRRATRAQGQVIPRWVLQISQDKTERLEPSQVEPKSSDNPKNQSPIQLEKQHGPSDQQVGATRAWAELEPGRPAFNCRRWSYATVTDLQRRSRVSLQRRWPRGHIPRPAGLGEAVRPHLAASEALAWRKRQA